MRLVTLMLAFSLLPAAAAGGPSGINLSWDDCGLNGTEVKLFACDTNAGVATLYASAVIGVAMPQLNGVAPVIDMATSGPALSDWWQFSGCRAGSLTAIFDFTAGPSSCVDVWAGRAFGGLSYTAGFGEPNRARLRGVAAIAGTTPADATSEYYFFAFRFGYQKSVGEGSCAGCTDKACLILNSVLLTQPAGVGDYFLNITLDRSWAFWRCPGSRPGHSGGCTFSCTVPTLKPSWGTIKSLYR